MTRDIFYREAESYRIAVDRAGVGSVRVLRRVNFKTFIRIFRDLFVEIKKVNPARTHIMFYVSRSLYEDLSENTREFLDFCSVCMDASFELIIVE